MLIAAIILAVLLLLGWAWWSGPLAGLRKWLFVRLYDRVQLRYEEFLVERRRELVSGLSGRVLEIGPGTGANLAHLPESVAWSGLEPNRWMRERLRDRADEAGRSIAFVELGDGRIDAPDASFDGVLSTLVLCSVPDPFASLAEIRRVLRPGGRLHFLEHTAAPAGSGLRRWQRILRPFWVFVADGCRPDRDTVAALEGAGFEDLEVTHFEVPKPPAPRFVSPHITGTAVR